jgi:hypothetical protein
LPAQAPDSLPILQVEIDVGTHDYRKGEGVRQEFNVLALIKGEERYVFVYDDASRSALLELFREKAADAACSLNWFDAAVLTEKAWEQAQAQAKQPKPPKQPPRRI